MTATHTLCCSAGIPQGRVAAPPPYSPAPRTPRFHFQGRVPPAGPAAALYAARPHHGADRNGQARGGGKRNEKKTAQAVCSTTHVWLRGGEVAWACSRRSPHHGADRKSQARGEALFRQPPPA